MRRARWNFTNEHEKRAYLAPRLRRLYPEFRTGGDCYRECLRRVLLKAGTVLDIGCGRGGMISEFVRPGLTIIGADTDPEALSANLTIQEKILADAAALPVGDQTIDVVTAEFVLEHLSDPERAFREISRVLKPGGNFVFLTPNVCNPIMSLSRLTPTAWHRWLRKRWLQKDEATFPAHYRANTIRQLVRLAGRNNLTVHGLRRAGNPEYLALVKPLVVPAILAERFLDHPGVRWLMMYLVGNFTKPWTGRSLIPQREST